MTTTATFTTRKAAFHAITLATARIAKATTAIEADTALIAACQALIPTLPEQVVVDRRVFAEGDQLTFNFGRGESRKPLVGTVRAVKAKEDGTVEAYRVEVGTGFDSELFTVQPGAVVVADSSPSTVPPAGEEQVGEATPAEPVSGDADDLLNDIGNNDFIIA